jgi:hypothetical protein
MQGSHVRRVIAGMVALSLLNYLQAQDFWPNSSYAPEHYLEMLTFFFYLNAIAEAIENN